MAQTFNINNVLLTGQHTINFGGTNQSWSNALLTIDRTIAGGMNSLPQSESLTVSIDYSPDGGTTWFNVAGQAWPCGVYVTKGVTASQDQLAIGIGRPFPVGTTFRVNTTATSPVRVSGTVVYS